MALLSASTSADVERLGEELSRGLRHAQSLEQAAQWLTVRLTALYPSIVLARIFATVPYARLPAAESRFASTAAGDIALLPGTDVLTLLASSGTEAAWNDRKLSRSHLAIPLLDHARIDDIPMVSRLLSDLSFRLQSDTHADPFITRAFANANGLFYVEDAGTTRDAKGRRIIPGADFVRDQRIHSVFGFGGSYVLRPMFVSTIVFTQERVSKQTALEFIQLSSTFKAGTTRFVTRGQLFEGERTAISNA